MIGCIPLWFTDNPTQCGPFTLTTEARTAVFDLLFDLYSGLYTSQSSQCPSPCSTSTYQAQHKSTDVKSEGMDMFIIYDQVVEVSRAQLVTNTFTLVNRLGGCIGFCKEGFFIFIQFIMMQ